MKQFLNLFAIIILFGCDKAAGDAAAFNNTSGQGGSLARFTVAGNYLYTVDKQKLKVYDISNGSQPVFKSSVSVGFEIETIFPFKDKLFIGSTSVVYIFSIEDPAQPKKLAEAISPTVMRRCDPVVAKDTVAYATLRTNGPCGGVQSVLAVFNIKDVTNPIQMGSFPVSEPYGLGYSGNTLYVADKMNGLMVFDISKAYTPQLIKNVSIPGSDVIDVIPYNNILVCWASDGMLVYDISNAKDPVLIKKIV